MPLGLLQWGLRYAQAEFAAAVALVVEAHLLDQCSHPQILAILRDQEEDCERLEGRSQYD